MRVIKNLLMKIKKKPPELRHICNCSTCTKKKLWGLLWAFFLKVALLKEEEELQS